MNLTGKTALVTGGARRVGKAIVLALAAHGADVIVHYGHSEDEARQTADQIGAMGRHARIIQADLADPVAIEQLFEIVAANYGRLDVLVNSASAFQQKPVLEITAEDWDYTLNVNLRAPFLASQRAARLMDAAGGVIVNISDVAGLVGWARYAHHSVSKAGLIMLTRVLAKALAPMVRVNAVVPGPVLRPEGMDEDRWARLGDRLPLKRVGRPEDVGAAVVALVENDFITGAVLTVDGGDSLVGSVDAL